MNKIQLRTMLRLASLVRNNAFYFSEDPFNKFKQRKGKKDQKKSEQKSSEYEDKISDKQIKQDQTAHSNNKRQERANADLSKGFSRFGDKKYSQNNEKPKQKEYEPIKESKDEEKPEKFSQGFSRFSRKKKNDNDNISKQSDKFKAAQLEKKQQKKPDRRPPRITIEFNDGQLDNKPKMSLKKSNTKYTYPDKEKIKEQIPKKDEEIHEENHQITPEQEQRWKAFQERMQSQKQKILPKGLRYFRQNLIKQKEREKYENNNKSPNEPLPTNLTDNIIKLIGVGVGLMLYSSIEEYFNKGKQVQADYLQSALKEGRITQTWIDEVEVQGSNDEHAKGKNIHKSIYITEKNGDVSFCASNPQFEKQWFDLVIQYNRQIDIKANGLYQVPTTVQAGHQPEPLPLKVLISDKTSSRQSSPVSTTRSILSMVLLYYFIKSITSLGKGRKGGKGGGSLSMFQNEKSYRFKEHIKVTFQDVVGMQKAKEQIVQFIDFLKNPEKYNRLGARIPKGALLTGPPGTGKTMIAKACAGQSNVPFFTISGSEFIEMYVGVGAQRVRNIFKEAKQSAPSIIFIDQIDAVGKKRTSGFGGNDERDTTLNQLLVQMDGFDNSTNVIVFAATNQKQVLDPALTRPGRFDRLIDVELPDLEGRAEIFMVHLKPLVLDKNIELKEYARRLATLTPGFSGADIKNVCNEAAIIAARNSKQFISIVDFEMATERIIGGVEKKSQLITPQTRKTVAYHECGHGVVSWFLKYSNPLLKLTIIPRSKGALGFAQYLPNQHQIYTKDKLMDQLCVILGGRVAEQIFFGKISTGASDDLNKAYQIAKTFVTQFGFAQKIGWMQYDETQYAKDYSKAIENNIDEQILKIMQICSERTRKIINEKKQLIGNLAQKLLEAQTIDQTIIEDILGPRPYEMSKQHQEYVKEKRRMSDDVKAEALKQTQAQINEKKLEFKPSDYML